MSRLVYLFLREIIVFLIRYVKANIYLQCKIIRMHNFYVTKKTSHSILSFLSPPYIQVRLTITMLVFGWLVGFISLSTSLATSWLKTRNDEVEPFSQPEWFFLMYRMHGLHGLITGFLS